jgi:hypothetical protein
MDKVAFLPFGLLIDRWRWNVFNGTIKPAQYETAWNDMRLNIRASCRLPRGADAFDPGAKYHRPAVVPYTRYFLARVLQFQFFEAACKQAGWKGPLHRCSFYGNKAVGQKLNAMLTMGASKPWPDALEAFTGSREMSAADGALFRAAFALAGAAEPRQGLRLVGPAPDKVLRGAISVTILSNHKMVRGCHDETAPDCRFWLWEVPLRPRCPPTPA